LTARPERKRLRCEIGFPAQIASPRGHELRELELNLALPARIVLEGDGDAPRLAASGIDEHVGIAHAAGAVAIVVATVAAWLTHAYAVVLTAARPRATAEIAVDRHHARIPPLRALPEAREIVGEIHHPVASGAHAVAEVHGGATLRRGRGPRGFDVHGSSVC